ncbi:MAG: GIY-YIG nuclease family protein [Chloroflexi bacterium]|nr:GIY-YIG nuclease family protein [Chloroflexota bacterium]
MKVELTPDKGTYVLHLRLAIPTQLTIGKLGPFDFPAGGYAYVGSALGSGGLQGRLNHHLASVKRPHWHIDYLRQAAVVVAIWYVVSPIRYEHVWASALQKRSDKPVFIPRFGASDCSCTTHLFRFESIPSLEDFAGLFGDDVQIQQHMPFFVE